MWPVSNDKRRKLNLEAVRLIKSLGLSIGEQETNYDMLREEKYGFVGYANYYVKRCWDEQKLINTADIAIYEKFLEIDTKLGTTSTEQLFNLVFSADRIDLVMVWNDFCFFKLTIFQTIDMDSVDFAYVGRNGFTIFSICFQRYKCSFHIKTTRLFKACDKHRSNIFLLGRRRTQKRI